MDIVLTVIGVTVFVFASHRIVERILFGPRGRNKGRGFNITRGRWRVMYPDGRASEPMCWDVANEYAYLYDGYVVKK